MAPYLTYAGYQALGGKLTPEQFDELLQPASDVLDAMTRDFYQFHDLDTDVAFRQNKFKRALVAQMAFFERRGSTSIDGDGSISTLIIGRTHVSEGNGSKVGNTGTYTDLFSQDALMLLAPTGLLYRGLGGGCHC